MNTSNSMPENSRRAGAPQSTSNSAWAVPPANTGEMEKAYNIDVILSENFAEIAREGAPDNSQIYYDMVVVPDVLVEENEIKRRGVKQTTREDRLFWVRDENGSLVRAATNYPNLDRWQIDISDETVQTRFANRTGLGSETNITYSDESQKNTAEHFDMVFNNHISKKTMKQRVLNALRNLLIRK